MTTAATTELEAINIMLAAIGEAPVNSLLGTLPVDVNIHDHPTVDAVQRGSKLYDRNKHQDTFEEDLKCEVIYFLRFDEITEDARRYINIKAARIFVDRSVTDDSLRTYTKEDELRARSALLDADTNNADHNMLIGDPSLTGRFNTFNPSQALIR